MGRGILLLGLVVFIAVHSVSIFNEAWRNRMVDKIGEWPWKGLYSLVAFTGLMLIVWGYDLARQDPWALYSSPIGLRYLAMLLLLPVFPLLLSTYLHGRIQAATRHPMLVATMLWAIAHLLVNGMLADVLLFGAFLVWAVMDSVSMKHRTQPSVLGFPPSKANDSIAVIVGLALYAAFVMGLHSWLIGVPVIGS